jgi:hypothetical protein
MIQIGTLDVSGSALGDGPDVGGENFGIAPLEAFIAFPQGFRDGAGHGFAGGLGYGVSIFLYQVSTLLYHSVLPDSRQGNFSL